jgi:elongation factor P
VALSINDLKNGLTILVEGDCYVILDSQFVKPGKGAAFTRCKMRNMRTGNVLERTFRGDEKIDEAYIEESKLQYLYTSGDLLYFMDNENFEEKPYRKTWWVTSQVLKDNLDVIALSYKDPFSRSICRISSYILSRTRNLVSRRYRKADKARDDRVGRYYPGSTVH